MSLNFKQLSFWFLPIVLCFCFEFALAEFRIYNVRNFLENIGFAISLLVLISVFQAFSWKSKLAKVIYILFLFSLFIESSFYYLFSTYFSASSIFILLETNPAEAIEFTKMYFDIHLVWFFLLHLGFIILYLKSKYQPILTFKLRIKPSYKLLFFISLLAMIKLSGLIVANFPYHLLKGVSGYIYEIEKYEDLEIDTKTGNFQNVDFLGENSAHTFVMIIGESTTRRQMGIYDFYRETTPLLSQRKSDLLIYDDVLSSEAHTIPSLQAALSLNNFENKTESTIIQLMNQAGFKTFWLSNQRPIGMYETLLTKLSKAADVYKYTNTAQWGSVTPYDEVLLPYLDEALQDKSKNKFIVINLLATHGQYHLRYSDRFKTFTEIPKTKFHSEKSYKSINDYHNAITYVDFMVDEIIDRVEAQNQKSYVLYFSDHGEEVFFDRDFFGHNDSDVPTRSMFEIPFFVWLSPEYKSTYELNFKPKRPYVINDLLHSMSDLSRIHFEEHKPNRSIFSDDFKPKPRIIGSGIDYDEYFEDYLKAD
ncbi:sulfatase-like hydrolase/transferase [Psychroflexus aestuariivivens]|uniref:sulfatase-like hydrolase/transferase n=1 Tax=Psychroflexus aestuariivivens TaxID=1795040 RepID=UPI000FD7E643|nr:sulfatase-like hydrolase/transferase [Psychroflexus aestuariivivens]